jgi:ADP-heptose:LPS heptosyltransferase
MQLLIRRSSSGADPGATGGRGNPRLRRLDQTAGLGILIALGALRRTRRLHTSPRRIGLMKTAGIGDMILLSAITRGVRTALPDSELVVLAGPGNSDLATLLPGVRVVELPTARPWAAIPLLRAERLDALLDFGQWTRLEALYSALSGARWIAGFDTPGQRRHYAYDAVAVHSGEVSELENFRALARLLGVESTAVPSFDAGEPPEWLPVPEPYVVFHMWPGGYRSELREWPAERWIELAQRVDGEGFSIVLTGGPGDVARTGEFVTACRELGLEPVSIAGQHRVSGLVDLLAGARCVVSVNTGIMHLAAAVGAPTVALNGPTSAKRWGPVGPRAVCVDSDLPGCGYLNLGFEYEGRRTDCMHGISVDRVAAVALDHARV